ncbi:MAG: riboflavin synthase [Candidatus Kuenenia sp.]|nr:riboflavin synthase [Candidatus Kuenenia hertensis]
MFTGIIEHLVMVNKLSTSPNGAELFLALGDFYDDLVIGESISVNGVCLTVKTISGNVVSFDVSGETLKKTTLGTLRSREKVNVERALRIGDRLGGHFVTGHADGIGTIKEKKQAAGQCHITFSTEKRFTDMLIEKGSVAIDGISLTNFDIKEFTFSVALIPHTLASTTLGYKKAGDRINIEIDLMGKWIKKLLENNFSRGKSTITREKLFEQGFS